MSAEIYASPEEVTLPKTVFEDYENWQANEVDYLKRLKQHLNDIGYKGKNVGEIIKFPVADSQALYMVLSMRPLRLIHLELGDCWTFQYIHLMTAKEVQQQIDGQKRIEAFFKKRN